MRHQLYAKTIGTAAAAAVLGIGLLGNTPPGQARDRDGNEERIALGLAIAPVPLALSGRDQSLIGMGSYLVNAMADCNGCHSAGPATAFAPGRNPFFGQPGLANPTTYLAGGRDFGPLVPNSPNIISRNLTPDKTGFTGGHTFSEFFQIMRTGVDVDHLHPPCSPTVTTNCLAPPFNGALLQIMPWYVFQNLTVDDLRAIYEYLSAIPCIEGGPGEPAKRCQ